MNDLDRALRTMLATRAQDITELPAHVADLDAAVPAPDRVRHARLRLPLLVAASVATVLAIVGTVLVIGHAESPGHGGSGTRPGTSVPSPSSTSSPRRVAAPATYRLTCSTTEPPSWRAAFATTSDYDAVPLAVDGRSVVVARDHGDARDVSVVAPNGGVRKVYDVPDPDQNAVLSAAVDGHFLLVPVSNAPRNGNGVDPSIVRLDVVDLRTGRIAPVTTAPVTEVDGQEGRTIEAATLFRGTVYWDEEAAYADRVATVHAYDVATGASRTVRTQPAIHQDGPIVKADGLYWSQFATKPGIATHLPSAVSGLLTTARARRSLITNGIDYAFNVTGNEIGYWAPGMSRATVFRTGDVNGYPSGVAGGVVVFGGHALDTRTAAMTPVRELPVLSFSTPTRIVAGNGVGSMVMTVVDAAALPALRC